MNTLRTLKQTYQIPNKLFIDTIELLQTGLYYEIKNQIYEYIVENIRLTQYVTTYNTFTDFLNNFISYLQKHKVLNYTEFKKHKDILYEIYIFYTF